MKALFIIAPENFRDEELLKPKKILESEGIEVDVVSLRKGRIRGMLGSEVEVSKTIDEVDIEDYDAVILVGGIGATVFFDNEDVHRIFREAHESGKVVGAICISPVTLAKAGLLKGRRATVWHSEANTIKELGANYTGNPVEVDGGIVTANGPTAAEEFGKAIVKLLKGE
jgi:protease I